MHRKICYYLEETERIINGLEQYPITCEIDPSNRCQNQCSFCMYTKYRKENNIDLDMDVYTNLLKELNELGVKSITFTGGGEPTMNPNFCDMVLMASEMGFKLGLITNGIKLNELSTLLPSFSFIRISLDAASAETFKQLKKINAFHKIVENIANTVKVKPKDMVLGLSFVVCEENKHEIDVAKSLSTELNTDYIQFKPIFGTTLSSDLESASKIITTQRYSITSRLPCHIAGLIGIVGADSNIYYCCQHRGDKDFVVGNLNTSTFKELWHKRNTKMRPIIKSCTTCRYMNYAKGYEEFKDTKYSFLRHKYFL